MTNGKKAVASILLNALCVFMGVYGIVFGCVTAYNLIVDAGTIITVAAISAVGFCTFFYVRVFKKTLGITASLIWAGAFLAYFSDIKNGFFIFLNAITTRMSMFSSSIYPTEEVSLGFSGTMHACTVFFSFVVFVLSAVLCLSLIRGWIWLSILTAVPAFSVCLFFVKDVPDIIPVIAFVGFMLVTVLSCTIRTGDKHRASSMLSLFIPLTLAFLIAVNAVFPANSRTDFANMMYGFFSDLLPINTIKTSQHVLSEDSSGEINISQGISEEESGGIPSDKPKDYESVDLINSEPSITGKVMMQIKTDKPGKQLLRGFSVDIYTGDSWEVFDQNTQSIFTETIRAVTNYSGSSALFSPITGSAFSVMIMENSRQYSIEISDKIKGGVIAYTPYYPFISGSHNYRFDNSVVLYKPNALQDRDENALYNFDYYDCGRVSADNEGILSYSRYEIAQYYEMLYREYAYMFYTVINREHSDFINQFISEEGFLLIEDKDELVDAVTEFVKNSATYSLNPTKTPSGRDFVEFFLNEDKQGYCMHFATAATLIFRTLGVPARYVSGYSANVESDRISSWVDVTDKEAHAWVEVYFDGIGWVPVDVTPAEPSGGGESSEPQHSSDPSSSDASSETSSHASVVSSEAESSDSSSAAESLSSNSSESVIGNGDNKLAWLYAVIFGFIGVVSLILRRRSIKRARLKALNQSSTNRAVIYAWDLLSRLKPYGVIPDDNIYVIAQKAAFSLHTLSERERRIVVDYTLERAKQVDKELSVFRRAVFRYIRILN